MTLQITVYLMAFGEVVPIPERIVDLPEGEMGVLLLKSVDLDTFEEKEKFSLDTMLNLTFQYGQNDFQPKPIRSVSVGDVIKLPDGSLHRVRGVGFEPLPAGTDVTTLERGLA